jgi:hypothetical protein
MNGRAGGSDVRSCTRDRIVETRRPTHEGEDETAVLNPNRGVVAARLVETVEDFVLLWIEPGGDNAESEDLHRWFNRLVSFARSTPLPARQSERDFTEVNHTFGPSGARLCSPRATASVRAFICAREAMPMRTVVFLVT